MEKFSHFNKKVTKCENISYNTTAWLMMKDLPVSTGIAEIFLGEAGLQLNKASAKCADGDVFDERKGRIIASAKVQAKLHEKRLKDVYAIRNYLERELVELEKLIAEEDVKLRHQIERLDKFQGYWKRSDNRYGNDYGNVDYKPENGDTLEQTWTGGYAMW